MIAFNTHMAEHDTEVYFLNGFSVEIASGRLDGISVPVDCVVLSLFFEDKFVGTRITEYVMTRDDALRMMIAVGNQVEKLDKSKGAT